MEHNGHARRKKPWSLCTVSLRVLNIANTSRTIEGEELGKEANSAHIAGLNMTETWQDGEDSSRDMETEGREGSNGRALEPEPQKG